MSSSSSAALRLRAAGLGLDLRDHSNLPCCCIRVFAFQHTSMHTGTSLISDRQGEGRAVLMPDPSDERVPAE